MTKIYLFLSGEQFHPEVLVKHAIAAENAGFDGVMISEHFHPWVDDVGTSGFTLTTLGAIAYATTSIRLMTAVTVPLYRFHPAVIAQAAATIDRLSHGRFELGIGTGENINEAPLGFGLPPYKERSERLKESIHIMRNLLNSEKLDFNGKYYKTNAAKLYSEPLTYLPIFLAAGGAQSAATAGKLCDGVICSVKNVEDTLENIVKPALREANSNKDFSFIMTRWTVYANNNREAWQALLPQRGLRAPSRHSAVDPLYLQNEVDALPRKEILSKYDIINKPSDYVKIYGPLITELGADVVGIQTTSLDQFATIKMLGEKVLPRLRRLKSLDKKELYEVRHTN